MNYTKDKAKRRTTYLNVYNQRIHKRFVTKAKEKDLVPGFLLQAKYKIIGFLTGLRSSKSRGCLQTREFDTLEDILNGVRGLTPTDSDGEASKPRSSQSRK
ncbi:hypothetical protein PHMEG_0005672 [Phytophthora megakarya]|uniref:Uncharacterized protein n=1 Tax=Phytophthora megakarya TaxID=4795 RepID=A0A225WQR9_9STRA|nr:hypothetical protein PHMEG_0005672 [Phytophthora megakarya]